MALVFVLLIIYESTLICRAEDSDYPDWGHGPWQQVQQVLGVLGPQDLIVPDMTGINLMLNPYPYMENENLLHDRMPLIIPWERAQVLISPESIAARRNMTFFSFSNRSLLPSLEHVKTAAHYNEIKRIIFFKSWIPEFYNLLVCREVEKDILYVEKPSPGKSGFAVIAIQKATFEKDVLPSNGKAHMCFVNE